MQDLSFHIESTSPFRLPSGIQKGRLDGDGIFKFVRNVTIRRYFSVGSIIHWKFAMEKLYFARFLSVFFSSAINVCS